MYFIVINEKASIILLKQEGGPMGVLIKNVNVINVADCSISTKTDVLIEGAIIKVIKEGQSEEGHELLNGNGKFLSPGFIDCHVHLGLDASTHPMKNFAISTPVDSVLRASVNASKMLRAGFTTIRDCGGVGDEIIKLRDSIYNDASDGPDIVSCGQAMLMTGGHFTGAVIDGPIEALKAARRLLHEGADFLKFMATGGLGKPGEKPGVPELSVDEMKAAIDVGKAHEKKSAAHTHGTEGMFNAIEAGIDTLEHCTMLTEEVSEAIIKNDIYIIPTFAPYKIMTSLGVEAGLPDYMVESSKYIYEEKVPRFKKAYEAGVKIAYGTDAGSPLNPHEDIAVEVKAMYEAGVSINDIMRSITINAADAVALGDHIGQVKEGYKANLVLLNSNPLSNLDAYEDIANVIVRGEAVK